jgi:hypothetical protein
VKNVGDATGYNSLREIMGASPIGGVAPNGPIGPIADTIGQVPTDILRNTAAEAAAGAVRNYDDPGRGALLGAAGGLTGSALDIGGAAIGGVSPGDQGLTPGTASSDLMTPDLSSPVPDIFDPQFISEPGAMQAIGQYRGNVWQGVADDNAWRSIGDRAIQGGIGVGKSAVQTGALAPLAQALQPPPVVPDPQIDPYAFFRTMPGVTRRRLL